MKKTVLILHGYPRIHTEGLLFNYFEKKNYKTISSNLFSDNHPFTLPEVRRQIKLTLNGLNPDVVIGVSLGGLILPNVATNYPEAKLIFVASSVSANPKSKLFKSLLNILATTKLLKFAVKLPFPVLSRLYTFFNPFYGTQKDRRAYEKDKEKNLKAIREIPLEKHREILRLIISTDNSSILPKLEQSTLILSSNHDPLTPFSEGRKLHRLLKNSKLIKTKGGHFEVIGNSEIREIEDFVNS